jgi:hypothetical protein
LLEAIGPAVSALVLAVGAATIAIDTLAIVTLLKLIQFVIATRWEFAFHITAACIISVTVVAFLLGITIDEAIAAFRSGTIQIAVGRVCGIGGRGIACL